jgi:hypothetical protein
MKKLNVVKEQIEEIFSHAVALDQLGGLRNTIFANGREIFILNYDHTVLLRFRITHGKPFDHPVSFRANDYDSNQFYEEDGKIVFISKKDGYERKKSCAVPDQTPSDIKALFSSYAFDSDIETVSVAFGKGVLDSLDRALSHVEISAKEGESIKLVQRNIYSGAVIEVVPEKTFLNEVMPFDILPIGMKTNDFAALFAFRETITMEFPEPALSEDNADWVRVKGKDMMGIIACCLYDELIEIREANYGRQK